MPRKQTHEEFVQDIKNINPTIKIIGKYQKAKERIECSCNICNFEWNPMAYSLKYGIGCPNCGNIKKAKSQRKTHQEFISQIEELNPNIEILSEYLSARKPISYRCKIHDYNSVSTPDNLLRGYGCPYCAGKCMTEEDFVSRINTINNDIELLSKYKTVNDYLSCRCKRCGNIWDVSGKHLLEGSGCPICNISKGENRIVEILTNNNIHFESHKKYDDLLGVGGGKLSYDFYLPQYNLLIEFQGSQHEKPFEIFGGEERFKIQQEHDRRKREYAKLHNIQLLEIWYYDFDNIEKILYETLILNNVR